MALRFRFVWIGFSKYPMPQSHTFAYTSLMSDMFPHQHEGTCVAFFFSFCMKTDRQSKCNDAFQLPLKMA